MTFFKNRIGIAFNRQIRVFLFPHMTNRRWRIIVIYHSLQQKIEKDMGRFKLKKKMEWKTKFNEKKEVKIISKNVYITRFVPLTFGFHPWFFFSQIWCLYFQFMDTSKVFLVISITVSPRFEIATNEEFCLAWNKWFQFFKFWNLCVKFDKKKRI